MMYRVGYCTKMYRFLIFTFKTLTNDYNVSMSKTKQTLLIANIAPCSLSDTDLVLKHRHWRYKYVYTLRICLLEVQVEYNSMPNLLSSMRVNAVGYLLLHTWFLELLLWSSTLFF